jgi:ketosteroid isomerase-like protein
MSEENVEAVRLSIAAYQRGELEEATAYLAPEVVWEVGQELPARGPAAVREMWTRWNDEWERLDMICEEITGAGDKVFVAMRYHARGRLSGVAIDQRVFEVHTFSDGECVSKVDFETRTQALEAMGLSNETRVD